MTNTFSFAGEETIEGIQKLINCSDDTFIEIWSMQHEAAIKHLRTRGSLTGDPKFVFPPTEGNLGKRSAYQWMQARMKDRLSEFQGELPIWGLLSRPQFSNKKDDKLLRLEIPKSRMLVSFHKPWNDLRGIMARLEGCESSWPNNWVSYCYPYIYVDEVDEVDGESRFIDGDQDQTNGARPQRSNWDESKCRSSWERMFNLSLAKQAQLLWGLRLQTMTPSILSSDVRDEFSINYCPN